MKSDLVICIENEGYEVSLEKRKLYIKIDDPDTENHGQVRIIDESGDDYLFPESFFVAVTLPATVEEAVLNAAAK